jgi:hypothetical protein
MNLVNKQNTPFHGRLKQINFFKYQNLKEFLHYMKSISRVTSMTNWDGGNAIILRHDVDVDIKPAYILSLIEEGCDIESTFFVMVTSPLYNPLSSENQKMLSKMANNGFEIGLHFDPFIYGNISLNKLKSKVDMEAKILESICNHKVTSVSLHNPSIHGQFPIFDGYRNAYHKDIFSDDVYLSDSCMNFRDKNPFEFVKRAKKTPIQILLHPIHYTEEGNNYIAIFCNYILEMTEYIDMNLRVNSTYSSLIGNEKLIDYIIQIYQESPPIRKRERHLITNKRE